MPISVCPVGTVAAPAERVWTVLMQPETYDEWWDARTQRIEPPGPARAGQVVQATARGFGRTWPVTTEVLAVDAERRALDLRTALPLGLVVRNHLTVQPLDERSSRVTFG